MRRRITILHVCLFVLAALMAMPADGAIRKRKVRERRNPDSLIQIQSDRSQLLPIYNQNGVLYLTARLNKGKNWLGGLPRGRYFINNRPITIN